MYYKEKVSKDEENGLTYAFRKKEKKQKKGKEKNLLGLHLDVIGSQGNLKRMDRHKTMPLLQKMMAEEMPLRQVCNSRDGLTPL